MLGLATVIAIMKIGDLYVIKTFNQAFI